MRLSKKNIGKKVVIMDCRNSLVTSGTKGVIEDVVGGEYSVMVRETLVVSVEPKNVKEVK